MTTTCRVCGDTGIAWLDLGDQPLANGLWRAGDVPPRYPLRVRRCPSCALSFLDTVVPAAQLYAAYPYQSGVSEGWKTHTTHLARWLRRRCSVDAIVFDIGANDLTLVNALREVGLDAWGVDPMVPENHLRGFFPDATRDVPAEYVDVITATNVLGHVDDVHAFVAECARILSPDGLLVIEVPALDALLAGAAFDTIYHEHLSYWSVMALDRLLTAHDFALVDLQRVPTHGGSHRAVAMRHRGAGESWGETAFLTGAPYERFYHAVDARCRRLTAALAEPGTWAGFGAAAKGTVLASRLGLDASRLAYVVDDTLAKQGWLTPYGVPIRPVHTLRDAPVDHVFNFAWNWHEAVTDRLAPYRVHVVSAA